VLVLDLHMRRGLSLSTIAELRAASPTTAIVILTTVSTGDGQPTCVSAVLPLPS
jgi:DNA-binding NarL/FixJ family response regulator